MSEGRADARHASRLGAVQALYQMEMSGSGAEEVAQEFAEHRFAELPAAPDEEFFAAIVNGVPQHQVEIDRAIVASLSEKWRLERVDSILRAILRCGVFELVARRDVPAKVAVRFSLLNANWTFSTSHLRSDGSWLASALRAMRASLKIKC